MVLGADSCGLISGIEPQIRACRFLELICRSVVRQGATEWGRRVPQSSGGRALSCVQCRRSGGSPV